MRPLLRRLVVNSLPKELKTYEATLDLKRITL